MKLFIFMLLLLLSSVSLAGEGVKFSPNAKGLDLCIDAYQKGNRYSPTRFEGTKTIFEEVSKIYGTDLVSVFMEEFPGGCVVFNTSKRWSPEGEYHYVPLSHGWWIVVKTKKETIYLWYYCFNRRDKNLKTVILERSVLGEEGYSAETPIDRKSITSIMEGSFEKDLILSHTSIMEGFFEKDFVISQKNSKISDDIRVLPHGTVPVPSSLYLLFLGLLPFLFMKRK